MSTTVASFGRQSIQAIATDGLALEAAERAFLALAEGRATVPTPLTWAFPESRGEVHVKGAHLHESGLFTFKVATAFHGNLELGVTTGSGIMMVFDASTGHPRAILADDGYLTDLRTAAAGALAARHLTHPEPLRVAVLGAGVQARMQIRLLRHVREIACLKAWTRSRAHGERYREALSTECGLDVVLEEEIGQAVEGAALVLTTTPSRQPLLGPGSIGAGTTVVAIGADHPGKQELDARMLADADKVVTDLTIQCAELGELQHALAQGLLTRDDVYAELGEIVAGHKPGREGDEIIVCDLTGVGAQDAALAEAVFVELAGTQARLA